MKKLFDKAKSALHKDGDRRPYNSVPQHQTPMQTSPRSVRPVTSLDVTRYRYHHGCNLGSVFVLERWLAGSMFPAGVEGSSELAAAEAWVKQEGIELARAKFERHWREYVSDSDLVWLRDVAKCTTIRLPIGYFTLGLSYCNGTPFEPVASVYQYAWNAVKELVRRCNDRGIGTLIDFHALPGGANAQEHSGTNRGKAELWTSRRYRDLALRCLCFIAEQASKMEGVAGIQIVNEAEHDARGMYDWYDNVLDELARIDPSLPIYVSDGWDLGRALSWSQRCNSARTTQLNPVVVDVHAYWCFSDEDKAKAPPRIIQDVRSKLSEVDDKTGSVMDRGGAQAIVGEYSCVLDEQTWAHVSDVRPKEALVREFGNAQSQNFQKQAGGAFFWTYRMDWMPGGEWGFKQMTECRAITPPTVLTLALADVQHRASNAGHQRAVRRQQTVEQHCQYWDTKFPGTYEHRLFEEGWDLGWSDAAAFFHMRQERGLDGADAIGMLDLWCLKRIRESGQGGKFVWEFEQGLRQGVRDFTDSVAV